MLTVFGVILVCLCTCVCSYMHMSAGTGGGYKRQQDLLELETVDAMSPLALVPDSELRPSARAVHTPDS